MKRAFSLILAIVLCLCLCSCGADEKYTALLEHLDSGNYEGIKAELSVLSSDFKAEQEQMQADAAMLAKYKDLIDLLEAEDFTAALKNINDRIPAPPEPTTTEVVITIDNWQDYLELKPIEVWLKNEFGETGEMLYLHSLCVRPEYADRMVWDKTDITVDLSIQMSFVECDIDFENKEFTVTKTRFSDDLHDVFTISGQYGHTRYDEFIENNAIGTHMYDTMSGITKELHQDADYTMNIFTITAVNRIQGSIFLLAE